MVVRFGAMGRMLGGAMLLVAGIAALIEAAGNHSAAYRATEYSTLSGGANTVAHPATGLSQTAYDLLRIGGYALLIFGALAVVAGLLRYSRSQSAPASR